MSVSPCTVTYEDDIQCLCLIATDIGKLKDGEIDEQLLNEIKIHEFRSFLRIANFRCEEENYQYAVKIINCLRDKFMEQI